MQKFLMPLKALGKGQKSVFLALFFTFLQVRLLWFAIFISGCFISQSLQRRVFCPNFPPMISVNNSFKFLRNGHQLWLNFNQGSLRKMRHVFFQMESNIPKTSNLSCQGGKSYLQNQIDEESLYRADGFYLSKFPLVINWD